MVRTPQGEETLLWDRCLFVRFWPGNEATRLGSISSFTTRRICAIPVDRGGSMSAVSAALLAMPRAAGARTGSPEKSAQKSESSRPSVDQRRLRLSCGDLLQLSVPWPTRWIKREARWCTGPYCTQKQFAAAVHHVGTPLKQRRAVQACSPRDWLQKEAHRILAAPWPLDCPFSSRTSP